MLKPDIRSLQSGDSRMWESAYYWLWPIAWSVALRRLGGSQPSDVEDIAILAISKAAEEVKAGKVDSFDELKALTAVIAERVGLDHLRRMQAAKRAISATESLEGHEDLATGDPGPLEQVDARDLAKLLHGLTAKLREPQRELLKAYYLKGLKQAEIAEKFGMKIGTVGVSLSRALEALHDELQRHPQLMKELREKARLL